MKLLAVHPGAELASARIRVVQMAPHLERLGARVDVVELPERYRERRELARRMNDADVVLLHYRLPTLGDALAWRDVRTPLVFDFDDAIRFRQRPKNGSWESSTRTARFERILRRADAFSCGNRTLAGLVEKTGKPVHLTPTPVPLDVPLRGDEERPGPVRLGWIGGRGNLDSLEALAEPLARLARERAVVLVVIADAAPRLAGVEVEAIPWSAATQEAELARLDVGLMPLEDTPWNRGKCAYKLLQYMAAGVASVGSPVGMNAELIAHGENGLLATTADEWHHALALLVDDAALRARLGSAGRATVERDYGYETVARGLFEFLAAR